MSHTTDTVRSQGFLVVECDVPAEMTLADWRARRQKRNQRTPRLRRRARRAGPGA